MIEPETKDLSKAPKQGANPLVIVPVLIFVALTIVFALSLKSGDPSRLPSALIGKTVPAVDFTPLAGLVAKGRPVPGIAATDLAKGDVTVVNYWASWCGPCLQEHPFLTQLSQSGVNVVGINYKDPPPGGRRFLGRHGNPYTAVGVDPAGRGAIEWGVYGMPETFVVDGKGRVTFKHVGPISSEILKNKLIPAISAAKRSS